MFNVQRLGFMDGNPGRNNVEMPHIGSPMRPCDSSAVGCMPRPSEPVKGSTHPVVGWRQKLDGTMGAGGKFDPIIASHREKSGCTEEEN